jgi:hypothetical protein
VVPCFALHNFLAPLRTRSSLKFLSPHKNFTKPSSSGAIHFNYIEIIIEFLKKQSKKTIRLLRRVFQDLRLLVL